MIRFAALLAMLTLSWPDMAWPVDLSGKYSGEDGTITVNQGSGSGMLLVEIESMDKTCRLTTDMRLVRNGKTFQLVSHEIPVSISFTRRGLILNKGEENMPEECENFAPQKPFKRR